MKLKTILAICLLLITLILSGCGTFMNATPTPTLTPVGYLPGWQLVWQDEFDGHAGETPDLEKWLYNTGGGGWGNREWEYYTKLPENASTDGNGSLVMTAIQVADPSAGTLYCWYGDCRFTSARILTQDRFEFTYGRVEARLKIPYGQGIWPAFWMLGENIGGSGWPKCGEIDIMENIGKEPSIIHGTVHGPGYSGEYGIGQAYTLPEGQKFSDDFHVFAMEWEAEEIRWYMDGNLYGTVTKDRIPPGKTWVFDHPFFIILNLAVGGNWPGYPDDTTTFPQQMLVDYLRVYQR